MINSVDDIGVGPFPICRMITKHVTGNYIQTHSLATAFASGYADPATVRVNVLEYS